MIIFLYGPDSFRSRQKLKEIIGEYKKIHKSGLNLGIFNLEEKNYQDFINVLESISMFKEKKLLILENAFSNKDFKEKFLSNPGKIINSKEAIIFYEPKEISEDEFFKFLKKHGKLQEFKLLIGQNLRNWIKKEFQKHSIEVSPQITQLIMNSVGNDTWQLFNEIQKLVAFRKREGKIEEKDISLLIQPNIETDIFETIDAIALKNKRKAFTLIHKHLAKGDSPLYLLSMINFQFRNILEIKDLIEKNVPYYKILKTVKLHPFVIRKSYQQAERFTIAQLKKIYQRIFQVDLGIKTGKIESETALDILIVEF